MRKKAEVSLATIAKKLNVSVNTVSRALRDCYDISNDTKKIVCDCAFELGYIQKTKSSIKQKAPKTIALVYNSIMEPIFGIYSQKIIQSLKENKYEVMVFPCNEIKLSFTCLKSIFLQRIDMIISFLDVTNDALSIIENNKINIVVMGRKPENDKVSSVYFDEYDGGRQVGKYFASMNYKKVGYIGYNSTSFSELRKEGLKNICKSTNIQFTSKDIVDGDDVALEAEKLINSGCEALLYFNDVFALTASPYLQKRGLIVDSIGFDDISSKLSYVPYVKSVSFDLDNIVDTTIQFLLKLARDQELGQSQTYRKMIPTKLNFNY